MKVKITWFSPIKIVRQIDEMEMKRVWLITNYLILKYIVSYWILLNIIESLLNNYVNHISNASCDLHDILIEGFLRIGYNMSNIFTIDRRDMINTINGEDLYE